MEQKESESNQMDGTVSGGGVGGGSDSTNWWWALASVAQFGWGISSYTRGYAGDSRHMPLKAFAVASLLVGGAASASIVVLQYHDIRKVFYHPSYRSNFVLCGL